MNNYHLLHIDASAFLVERSYVHLVSHYGNQCPNSGILRVGCVKTSVRKTICCVALNLRDEDIIILKLQGNYVEKLTTWYMTNALENEFAAIIDRDNNLRRV